MSGRIETRRAGGVLTIVNDDPATKNALSPTFYEGCRQALEDAAADPEVGAIVITGAGGFFCSGGNVNGLRERAKGDRAARKKGVDGLHALIRTTRSCPKPVIAAVEGGAAGAGVALAFSCDLVVAAEGAYASVAYVKIGLTPDGGTTALLAALPRQLLAELVWTGDRVPMARLQGFGLVNRLVPEGEALAAAEAWAHELASGPGRAIASGKRLVDGAAHNTLDVQLDLEAEAIVDALGGAEAREGIAAFLEKRRPVWPR